MSLLGGNLPASGMCISIFSRILSLLPSITNSNKNRSVLHIFITAATTLLTHIISNPSNPLAQADLKLLEPLLTLLGILARGSKNEKVTEMYQSSMGLFEKATVAVQDCNAEDIWDQGNTGRESNQKETVEEFLRRMEMIKSGYGEDIDMTYPGDSDEFEGMYQLD
jgi:hypothetical protein